MKKILGIVGIGLGIFIYVSYSKTEIPSNVIAVKTVASSMSRGDKAGADAGSAETTGKMAAAEAVKNPVSVVNSAPEADKLREEAQKDPHSISDSLLLFSISLAPRLEESYRSPEAAERFYGELSACVTGRESRLTAPVRALCLMNALRLGQRLPALRARAQAMWEKADPEVKRLAK